MTIKNMPTHLKEPVVTLVHLESTMPAIISRSTIIIRGRRRCWSIIRSWQRQLLSSNVTGVVCTLNMKVSTIWLRNFNRSLSDYYLTHVNLTYLLLFSSLNLFLHNTDKEYQLLSQHEQIAHASGYKLIKCPQTGYVYCCKHNQSCKFYFGKSHFVFILSLIFDFSAKQEKEENRAASEAIAPL